MRATDRSRLRPLAVFLAGECALLAVVAGLGGPPWTALCALALVVQAVAGPRPDQLWPLAPAVAWPALFVAGGDRRLFFPFTMHLAAHLAMLFGRQRVLSGLVAGGMIVAAFLAVRVTQRAGPRVLVVEGVCAAAILGGVLMTRAASRRGAATHAGLAVGAALAAYACLAL